MTPPKPRLSAGQGTGSIPPGIIANPIARQLASAGVTVRPTYIPGSALGQYGPNGPITTGGQFNTLTNQITYLAQRTAPAIRGILEHEFVHAAGVNLPTVSFDPRYRYLSAYANSQREGRKPLSIALPALAYGLATGRSLPFDLSEGLADRSAYPDVPKWGDAIRRQIIGR